MNPLQTLHLFGQSGWTTSAASSSRVGELQRLIDDDCVSGLTTNPTMLAMAIGDGSDYDAALERLMVKDIQVAADQLLPFHEKAGGHDGYVCLEASPGCAAVTDATIAEARRLW